MLIDNVFLSNQPHPETRETACTVPSDDAIVLQPAVDADTITCGGGFFQGKYHLLLVKTQAPQLLLEYTSPIPEQFIHSTTICELPAPIKCVSYLNWSGKQYICALADKLYFFVKDDRGNYLPSSQIDCSADNAYPFADENKLYLVYDGAIRGLTNEMNGWSGEETVLESRGYKHSRGRYDRLYEEGRTIPGRHGGMLLKKDGIYHYFCCDTFYRCAMENKDTFLCLTENLEAILDKRYGQQNKECYLTRRYLVLPNGGIPTVFEGEGGQLFAAFVGATAHSPVFQRAAVVQLQLNSDEFYRPDDRYIYSNWPVDRMKPVTDEIAMRDTFIVLLQDGYYYLTGTTARPDGGYWKVTNGICLWRSKNLIDFESLGKVYDYLDTPHSWQNKVSPNHNCWAPEICYYDHTYWLTYSTAPGCGLLRSSTGKPEGPYEDYGRVVNRGIDSGFFIDDDGAWYLVWLNGRIAKLSAKGTDFEHEPVQLLPVDGQETGYEGAGIIKVNGKYVLYAAEWNGDLRIDGSYDMMYSVSDKLYGPYSKRHLLAPHAGHGCLFWDKENRLRFTMFGNDRTAPFNKGVGIGYVKIQQQDGTLLLSVEE